MKKSILIMALAACLAAVNVPFSKYLLTAMPVYLLASLTFLGGAIGSGLVFLILRLLKKDKEALLSGKDWLYVGIINLLDCGSNAMLFSGLALLSGETASLLQSFEVVATAFFAFTLFKEKASWRLLTGIALIVAASVLLSFDPEAGYEFKPAALLIVGATLCWGIDNNLTKKISGKDPLEFTMIKCATPGLVLLGVSLLLGERFYDGAMIGYSLLDGAISYGFSVVLLAYGFKKLSAAAGTTIYAANPFIGAILSLCFFPSVPSWSFYVALALLLLGEGFVSFDAFKEEKRQKSALT
jgi:drug/metabolite transporter (DMT)-like permease